MSIQAGESGGNGRFVERIGGDDAASSGGQPAAITLPDAEFLLRGDYSRDGDDLRIVKGNGESHTVEGYFSTDAPPALYAPNGAGLLFDTVAKLVGAHAAGYGEPLMVAGPVPGAEPIGTVKSLRGSATAKGADGQVRDLANGDPIYLNDAIETSDGSFLRILFEDGTAFFLGRNARAVIDEYVYQPEADAGSFAASIAVGFFRYISGKLGKLGAGDRPHTSIKTPTATIGIRGSDIEGEVDEQGNTTLVHHSGIIDVADINGLGMVTLLVPGTATVVSPEGVAAIFQAPTDMIQRFQQNLPPPANGDAPEGETPPQGDAPEGPPPAEGEAPPAGPGEGEGEEGQGEREPAPEGEPEEGEEPEGPEDGREPPEGRDREGEEEEDGGEEGDGPPPGGPIPVEAGEGREQGGREDDGEDRPLDLGLRGPAAEVEEIAALGGDYAANGAAPIPLDGGDDEAGEVEGGPLGALLDLGRVDEGDEDDEPDEPVDLPLSVTLQAVDDSYYSEGGAAVSGNVLGNDRNFAPDQARPYIFGHTAPAHGTLQVGRDGSFHYIPDAGFSGFDSFTYVVADGLGGRFPAVVEIEVTGGSAEPPEIDDFFSVTVGEVLSADLLANDRDVLAPGAVPRLVDHGQPQNGTLTVNPDGTFSYTPNAGFSGLDTFSYTVDDGLGGSLIGYVRIDVGGAIGPVGVDDHFLTATDQPVSGNVLSNDGAGLPAGATPTVVAFTQPFGGTVAVAEDGNFTYTPDAGFSGLDHFTYTAADGLGGRYSVEVEVEVVAAETPLAAVDDRYVVEMDVPLHGNLVDNDWAVLPAGATPQVIDYTLPAGGSLVLNPDGSFTYTPDAGFVGLDGFGYVLADGLGGQYAARVDIQVEDGGLPEEGINDYYRTQPDVQLSGDLLANDRAQAPAGAVLTLVSHTSPHNGTVTVNADGTFVYTPVAGFVGIDAFSYVVDDGQGNTANGLVGIDVGGLYDPTSSLDDEYATAVDRPVSGNLLADDYAAAPAGSVLTLVGYTQPLHGSVTVAANGDFTYTPQSGYSGGDFFSYTVTDGGSTKVAVVSIDVGGGPVHVAVDDYYYTDGGVPVSGNVIDNDGGVLPAGAVPVVVDHTMPTNGLLTLSADGSFTYTPTSGFVGMDGFTYIIDDGFGGRYEARVDIDVASAGGVSGDDDFVIDVNTPLTANLLANDMAVLPSGATPTLIANTTPSSGTLVVDANGDFTYTPVADFIGHDAFTYTIDDGLGGRHIFYVDIDVGGAGLANVDDFYYTPADVPVSANMLDNDGPRWADGATPTVSAVSDPLNGALAWGADGRFTYTPNAGYTGHDYFSYTVDDGLGGSYNAYVDIDIGVGGGIDDYYLAPVDGTLNGNLFDNDWSLIPAGGSLTLVSFTQPANGAITVNPDGSFTYTPHTGFSGIDTFSYVVDDGLGNQRTAGVTIDVGGGSVGNSIPVTGYDYYTVPLDTQAFGNVLDNDSDPDNDPLSAYLRDPPSHGTVNLTVSGAFTYTPEAGFTGSDFFSYTAEDGRGGIQVEWVEVEVGTTGGGTATNTAPFTGIDSYTTAIDTVVSGNVLANDHDPDGDPLTAWIDLLPSNGTLTLAADGNFTYQPNAGYVGSDSFKYAADDGRGGVTYQWVNIDVGGGAGNTAPLAGDDFFTAVAGTSLSGNVLANDYDADGDLLNAAVVSAPVGSLSLSADGNFTYTATAAVTGSDSFVYEISDGRGGYSIATVSITIDAAAGGNGAPVAGDDYFTTNEGTSVSGNLLANDSDPDGDPLAASLFSGPANGGTVSIATDGNFTYTPSAGLTGGDSFQYQISDGQGGTATATVNITINATAATNTAPMANGDSFTGPMDTTITGNVLGNDYDPDGDLLNVIGYSQPANGSVTVTNAGAMNYVPFAGYTGADSFNYTIDDGFGHTASATVSLNIT